MCCELPVQTPERVSLSPSCHAPCSAWHGALQPLQCPPMARPAKNTAWNEVFALILLGVGTLLFLALISYAPKDLPSWVPFSHLSPPNSPAQNFIGPLAAIVAGFCYFMIGAASDLLAVARLGFGVAKLFYARLNVSKRVEWIALFTIAGAGLLHLQAHR